MEVAVFINTFIRDDLLYRCVDSCLLHIPNCRLYITDNGLMTKEKQDFYKILEEAGHYVEIKEFNYPWRQAFNEKLDKLQGEKYVMKVDDDFYFEKEVKLQQIIEANKDVGLLGGQVFHLKHNKKAYYIFNIEEVKGRVEAGLIRRFVWLFADKHKPEGIVYCDVTPDFWLAKREIFDEVRMSGEVLIGQGGHEDFFMTIWSTDTNWKVAYTNDTVAMHENHNTEEYTEYRRAHEVTYKKKWGEIRMKGF